VKGLEEIRVRVEERHAENRRRFDIIDANIASLSTDVKSLLDTRSFSRGIWRTVTIVAAIISAAVSVVMAWVRNH
jgi:hypothetical protein